ncbi:MAG: ubiquinol-cytochrome c reductase iron-sulfur subunit [Actinomycetota bacterium]
MERRTFLGWFSVGWIASLFPVAFAACSNNSQKLESSETIANATTSGVCSDGFTVAGSVAQLTKDGQIFNKQSSVGPLLVIRTDSNDLSVVNPTCTHRGCTVAWKANQKEFVCPCHGARFAAEGKVLEGPAKLPLKTYEVKVEGDLVCVKAKGNSVTGTQPPESPQLQLSSHDKDDERGEKRDKNDKDHDRDDEKKHH